MHHCPHCHLENPDSALRCDCGFDFGSRTLQATYLTRKDLARVEEKRAIESDAYLIGRYWGVGLVIVLWRNFFRWHRRNYKTES